MKKNWLVFFVLWVFSGNAFARECVILLHGLVRTSASMEVLAERLEGNGYVVANIDYPSREHEIAVLANMAVEAGVARCHQSAATKIHFVTHSLGGILVRQYLQLNRLEQLGRTVMLGPPNQGSEAVDKLAKVPGFEFIHGPSGLQLGTGTGSIPNALGPANFEVGIIAGTKSINLILSRFIPGTDDGKVSIDRAHLDNEKDFLTMPVSHPFIMRDERVIDNVVHFLKNGVFEKR
ncbi:alpha/beta hydrolase [Aestuariicella hydrocarbonica]|uniref:Alpha/beta hydrolase n=1 Tax=Pseudomaricurvus hydrocarbonicus TaxID=1470433 RepID=A0A9E5MPX9_9GAMM|nr:alpha/beta hydrolase [Aestuariicella hydrocarbonica]NHO68255.1 alpha/beta hydrolase [Aestuariicella hydrocarbonica]